MSSELQAEGSDIAKGQRSPGPDMRCLYANVLVNA